MFPQQAVTGTQVRENLLRMKAPERAEEMDALWEASQGLSGIDLAQEAGEPPLPHPAHYADWFSYFDNIDLRRHLRDIEVVLIEAALEKSDGMVSQAAEALKLRRTTLIEKMKKLMIERPPFRKGRVGPISTRRSHKYRSYCGRLARYPFNCRILRPA